MCYTCCMAIHLTPNAAVNPEQIVALIQSEEGGILLTPYCRVTLSKTEYRQLREMLEYSTPTSRGGMRKRTRGKRL